MVPLITIIIKKRYTSQCPTIFNAEKTPHRDQCDDKKIHLSYLHCCWHGDNSCDSPVVFHNELAARRGFHRRTGDASGDVSAHRNGDGEARTLDLYNLT